MHIKPVGLLGTRVDWTGLRSLALFYSLGTIWYTIPIPNVRGDANPTGVTSI